MAHKLTTQLQRRLPRRLPHRAFNSANTQRGEMNIAEIAIANMAIGLKAAKSA